MLEEKLKEIANNTICPTACMMRDGKILFGNRHYKEASVWTMPGGRSDAGETVEEALRREVYEEVGIKNFEIVDFIAQVPGHHQEDMVPLFYCTTSEDPVLMEPEKFSEWRWVSKEEFLNDDKYSGFNMEVRNLLIEFLQNI